MTPAVSAFIERRTSPRKASASPQKTVNAFNRKRVCKQLSKKKSPVISLLRKKYTHVHPTCTRQSKKKLSDEFIASDCFTLVSTPTKTPLTPASSLSLKTLKFSRYLGAGSEGVVMEAICKGRHYAVKMITIPEGTFMPDQTALLSTKYKACSPSVKQMALEHEAQIMKRVGHAPNVIRFHSEIYASKGQLQAIACELATGSLQQRLDMLTGAQETISFQTAKRWVYQMAAGLSHIHARKIVHMDIKPANLLLDQKQVIKIADFGMAKDMKGHTTCVMATEDFAGTRDYMAPEILSLILKLKTHATYGYPVDIYAVGRIIECLDKVLENEPLALQLMHIAQTFLLEYNPEKRYTAKQLIQEVSKLR